MFNVEILIAGKWTMVYSRMSAWLANLAQTDLEYRCGDAARIVRIGTAPKA